MINKMKECAFEQPSWFYLYLHHFHFIFMRSDQLCNKVTSIRFWQKFASKCHCFWLTIPVVANAQFCILSSFWGNKSIISRHINLYQIFKISLRYMTRVYLFNLIFIKENYLDNSLLFLLPVERSFWGLKNTTIR